MNYGFVKVAAAVPNIQVADCIYNITQMEKMMRKAADKGVQIIVFPELSVTGYTCLDLFQQDLLLNSAENALLQLAENTADLPLLAFVGAPLRTDNKLILENLIRLSQDGARIYIRIPTIKEVNGNEENMKETIAFLKEHDIHPAGVNLLPYHDTGSGKYAKLDMEYKGTDLHAPDKEEMEALAALFVNAGFTNTKIGG